MSLLVKDYFKLLQIYVSNITQRQVTLSSGSLPVPNEWSSLLRFTLCEKGQLLQMHTLHFQ